MDNNTVVAPTLEERIFQIVAEEAEKPRESLDRDTALADHFDSLGRVELVMAMEDEFELSIPDEEAERIITIGHLIDEVESRLRKPRANEPDAHASPSH